MHTSVGAIIEKDGKILMLDRKNFPYGWACPAGHKEENEKPEEALIREALEETGLKIKKYKLLFHEFISWNECNRGEKGHHWYVFKAVSWESDIRKNEEAKEMKWIEKSEISKLLLEEIWAYIFKKLGIIK